jgi:protein-S-isoprenylcysteine O-methyltransferase
MSAQVQSFLASPGWGHRGMAAIGAEAFGLGVLMGLSVALSVFVTSLRPFFVFCTLLAVFHMTEFLFVAVYHSYTCGTESFLIPHSTAYSVAMGVSVLEYWIEWAFLGSFFNSATLFWIGLCIGLAGQFLRWTAFVTAGHNFTHMVSESKEAKHALVTDGVYRFVRHPGYCGWFWWSVGTQVMLANPVSAIGFAYFSYRFFSMRIAQEEALLESKEFFGEEYTRYKATTPTYIPFIL